MARFDKINCDMITLSDHDIERLQEGQIISVPVKEGGILQKTVHMRLG
jgi:hypothetical protein